MSSETTPDPQTEAQLRPSRIPAYTPHVLRFIILVIMVAFGLRLLLPQLAGLEEAVATVRAMPLWMVAIAGLAQFGNYGGTGLMMYLLTGLVGTRLPIVRGSIIAVAANSIGLVSGGTVGNSAFTYRWVRGSGIRRLGAGLCATIPLMLIHLVLLLASIVGLISLLVIHELTMVEVISFAVVLGILGILAGLAFYGMNHPDWLIRRATPIFARYHAFRRQSFDPQDVVDYVNQLVNVRVILRTGWHGPLIGAIVNLLFDMMTLYVLFLAAGYQVPIGILFAGYGLPLLVGRLPIVPGGMGVVEATMSAIFISLGAPRDATIVATLGFRLFSFWIPTLVGFPLAAYLQIVTRMPPEAPANAPTEPEGGPALPSDQPG